MLAAQTRADRARASDVAAAVTHDPRSPVGIAARNESLRSSGAHSVAAVADVPPEDEARANPQQQPPAEIESCKQTSQYSVS